jgi:hypothetical protein
MLRRQPIFSASDPQSVSSGLQPDLQELRQVLWADADNVRFYRGKVVREVPPIELFSPAFGGPIRGLSQQRDNAGVRWVWAASGPKISRWYGPASELIATMPTFHEDENVLYSATFTDFVHWGDWTIWNDSMGAIKIFKPGVGVATLGDAPVEVVAIRKKLNFLMAFGYGSRGTRVGWSDSDVIDSWTATPENAAGSLSIDDFDTRIKAAYPMSQYIAVYAEDQMALVSYISAPFYFGQKVALNGIGAVSKNAVTGDGQNNFGVGRNGVWWTDGNTYRYVDDALHDYLQEEVNWDQATKIHACRNDVTNCIDFYFPMRGSLVVNEGWSFDPQTVGWSRIQPLELMTERRLFSRPIGGTSDGKVELLSSDPTALAPLSLITKPLLMQGQGLQAPADPHTDVRMDELELFIKTASNVEFRVMSAEKIEGPYEISDWYAVENQAATYLLDQLATGTYWKIEFRSSAANWEFNLQGFLCYGMVDGSKRGV